MKITVVGAGYVGLVAGASFADFGIEVCCLDSNQEKVYRLNQGIMPIYEPGLEELIAKNKKLGYLSFSSEKILLENADVIVIAVGTPPKADGSADLRYIQEVLDDIVLLVASDKTIIIKSTVPVGTAQKVCKFLKEKRSDLKFHIISNPEFLREGSAVTDFLNPDRVIIGLGDQLSKEFVNKIYGPLIAKGVPLFYTDNATAELIKYASNAYLATRIAFVNEIANLAEKCGANIDEISLGMGLDKRIGRLCLNPGPGYGGSCFPKDTLAISKIANDNGLNFSIVNAAISANNKRKKDMAKKVIEILGKEPKEKIVAILGVTFKAETDDVRDSASIDIINELLACGVNIKAYDPKGLYEAYKIFGDKITYSSSAYDAVTAAECMVVVTEWSEFKSLDFKLIGNLLKNKLVIDLRNIYSLEEMKKRNFVYISVGRPKIIPSI